MSLVNPLIVYGDGAVGLAELKIIQKIRRDIDIGQIAKADRHPHHRRATAVLPKADKLIDNYRELRRVEGILRRWSYEGETVLPDDPAPYYRVSVRCGFETPESFRKTLARWREAIGLVKAPGSGVA